MKLEKYLERRGLNASQLAVELKMSRQVICNRIKKGHIVGEVNGKFTMYHPRDMVEVKAPPEVKTKKKIRRKLKPKQEK